ncbi:OB-fold nucleic acid binding domain-containing protein [Hymenobacter sp. BT186]|uniref:OB-fold nucleic acid binding domain-containing protein n=1 Tax=Hymenobacter telluris TaxID=2816474 RepID=A0A939EV75_9BACT|nr:OB-fold nucleic acid binding domain-containing protein [Hymenobacter telluris]MBO0358439.1 OB-fold nucleic acid binding domain-containing protein [Hymenobacter telluris]MBW3374465.1 OB-fold nucleic acid binding domain-containing protein [Hymenobacter norwichensis]
MHNSLKSHVLLAAFLLTGSATYAQTSTSSAKSDKATRKAARTAAATTPPTAGTQLAPPPPPAGGPQPGRGLSMGPGPGQPGKPGPKGGVQALTTLTGTLTDYSAANDDQVYDAFTLKTSTGTETVRFPRHLGQPLMAAAKAGSAVSISGFRDTNPEGQMAFHLVNLTAGGQTISNQRPTPPTTPPTEQSATVKGTVSSLRQDPKGRTQALILNDGTVLRLPPPAAEQLSEKLKVGTTVAATGTLHTLRPGEVTARPVRVVRAETLTLDGVQFLVQ